MEIRSGTAVQRGQADGVGGGGDHRGRAQSFGDPDGQRVGPAGVAAGQRHREPGGLVDHHHAGIGVLVAQQRRDDAGGGARGQVADDQVALGERPRQPGAGAVGVAAGRPAQDRIDPVRVRRAGRTAEHLPDHGFGPGRTRHLPTLARRERPSDHPGPLGVRIGRGAVEDQHPFSHGTGIHIEPYAAFSKKYKSLAELPQGATIAITNDASNQIRGLRLLEGAGLLTGITDSSNVLNLTKAQNPKGFVFVENQPEVIVQQLDDPTIDLAFVNGNFILTAGLSTKDALAVEGVKDNPYANLLVWRTDNTSPGVAKLEELLHSQQVKDFITKTWPSGDVLPG